jgi:hypothetical protein
MRLERELPRGRRHRSLNSRRRQKGFLRLQSRRRWRRCCGRR